MGLSSILEQMKKKAKEKVVDLLGGILPSTSPAADAIIEQPISNEPKSAPNVERHKVAGISFRESALLSLCTENPDFDLSKKQMIEEGLTDVRVYKINFDICSCDLVPEPDNPVDPKAIKVIADGVHIGYIKQGSCAHIHNLIREGRIDKVTCEIGGGQYKIITTDFDEDGEETYSLKRDTIPYWAAVTITLKN